MYCDENALVIELAPNTPAQDAELGLRTVVLRGTTHPMLDALHILLQKADSIVDQVVRKGMESVLHRALLAPHGRYRALSSDENIVAVHVKANGQINVYGPFEFDEEAYDYFPANGSPHDSWVAVFSIPVQSQ